jgi:hypothetical protein
MSNSNRKLSNLVTLQNIVRNFLNDLNIYNDFEYKRYMQWAIRGYMKLHMDYLHQPEVEYLTVDSNNIAHLPDDFVDYIRIGRISHGKIVTYSRNDNIMLPRGEICFQNNVNSDLQNSENGSVAYYNWEQAPMKIFNIGFYRVDYEYNRIIFSGDMVGKEVVVEYVSNGISLDGNTYIPRKAQEPMIAWLHYQKALNDGEAQSMIDRRAAIWGDELDRLECGELSFTAQELLDVLDSSRSTLVK